jgi:hypothetical protein
VSEHGEGLAGSGRQGRGITGVRASANTGRVLSLPLSVLVLLSTKHLCDVLAFGPYPRLHSPLHLLPAPGTPLMLPFEADLRPGNASCMHLTSHESNSDNALTACMCSKIHQRALSLRCARNALLALSSCIARPPSTSSTQCLFSSLCFSPALLRGSIEEE